MVGLTRGWSPFCQGTAAVLPRDGESYQRTVTLTRELPLSYQRTVSISLTKGRSVLPGDGHYLAKGRPQSYEGTRSDQGTGTLTTGQPPSYQGAAHVVG